MNACAQLVIVSALAFMGAGTTWLVVGSPERSAPCDPKAIKQDEICLKSIPSDANILWVDARPRSEWEKNGLPGSVLWNLDPNEDMQAFEAEVAMRVITTPQVVVYCSDESCGVSRQVAKRIRNLDLGAEVYVLFGGWSTLKEAGLVKDPTEKR